MYERTLSVNYRHKISLETYIFIEYVRYNDAKKYNNISLFYIYYSHIPEIGETASILIARVII